MKPRHNATLTHAPARRLHVDHREEIIERVYHDWDEALSHGDVEGLLALYASDAVLESPLVSHLLGKEKGICAGHDELRLLFEALRERKPPVRKHYRKDHFTDGRKLIWEYPRATPEGEQMDFVESMEINEDGLIQHHNVYWGWFGVGVLQRNEYHKKEETRGKAKQPHDERKAGKIAGYDYGEKKVAKSPVSLEELELLKQTVTLTDEDFRQLRLAGDVLEDQTEEIINTWRGVIGKTLHLARYFAGLDGKPDEHYQARTKERFKQWILDVCRRSYDQDWLNYQHEIGLRHTHLKKNQTDKASALPHIPLRYLIAFTAVINDTIKPFLAAKGAGAQAVEAMHRAWCKAVLLHVTLWSRPYVAESEW